MIIISKSEWVLALITHPWKFWPLRILFERTSKTWRKQKYPLSQLKQSPSNLLHGGSSKLCKFFFKIEHFPEIAQRIILRTFMVSKLHQWQTLGVNTLAGSEQGPHPYHEALKKYFWGLQPSTCIFSRNLRAQQGNAGGKQHWLGAEN